ncbi:MAG: hypothetical protein COB67_10820 [SAR324 cluster bacterium]|uniref:Phospholipid/glycerol acyltransferase domain-containing protein n=1 Tax=SAR324 cluster bacterium TaxID=2024889 RepID=A0A2A4SWQ4_9DELT|nr:MAG: hypothetical protein COB67_10820 [SAR324 cluster bacterium]
MIFKALKKVQISFLRVTNLEPGKPTSEKVSASVISDSDGTRQQLEKLLISDSDYDGLSSLREVLGQHDQVVHFFNHVSMLSWIPAFTYYLNRISETGFGYRKWHLVYNPLFAKNPIMQRLIKLAGMNEHQSYGGLLRGIREKTITDLFVAPEGANCIFGKTEEIRPFITHMTLDLVLRTEMPLLLTVHQGSEAWSKSVKLSPRLLSLLELVDQKIWRSICFNKNKSLALLSNSPYLSWFHFPRRIASFRMKSELFPLDYAYYQSLSGNEIQEYLQEESEKIRQRMQAIYDGFDRTPL